MITKFWREVEGLEGIWRMKLCTERERTRNSLVTISAVSSAELATLSDQSFVISLLIPFYNQTTLYIVSITNHSVT